MSAWGNDSLISTLMGHQESYKNNENYAQFLSGWDIGFYAKYADTLAPAKSGGLVLDVGCGVGQVVGRLHQQGFQVYGVDVSEPNIDRAKKVCPNCQVYNGKLLPFKDSFFESVGAFNVLEHVEEPEAFIQELVRVCQSGGKVIISSPNFFRVFGFRDYHPRMRGIGNKWKNWCRLRQKCGEIRQSPQTVRFDKMPAIIREPFSPDDDAIVATNGLEMKFFLEKYGCKVKSVSCTDRYVPKIADWIFNATPLRYLVFNAFVVAEKL